MLNISIKLEEYIGRHGLVFGDNVLVFNRKLDIWRVSRSLETENSILTNI